MKRCPEYDLIGFNVKSFKLLPQDHKQLTCENENYVTNSDVLTVMLNLKQSFHIRKLYARSTDVRKQNGTFPRLYSGLNYLHINMSLI